VKFEPFALSLVCPELVGGLKGFDRLSPNGSWEVNGPQPQWSMVCRTAQSV